MSMATNTVRDGVHYINANCAKCGCDFSWPESVVGYLGSNQYLCKGCEQERAATYDKHTFASGAQSSGRLPDFHLIPLLTLLERLAPRYSLGVSKGYGVDGWRKGLGDRDWVLDRANHGLAHMARVLDKLKCGVPTAEGDDDLAGALWSLVTIAESERQPTTDGIMIATKAVIKEVTKDMAVDKIWAGGGWLYPASSRCRFCGAVFSAHEVEGPVDGDGFRNRGHAIDAPGQAHLHGIFHWFEPANPNMNSFDRAYNTAGERTPLPPDVEERIAESTKAYRHGQQS